MKIFLWTLLMLAAAGSVQAANTIDWRSGTNDVIYVSDHLGAILNPQIETNSALKGDGLSGLIQLIYAGANGTADYAYAASSTVGGVFSGTIGTGVFTNGQAVDDVVVAYKWIGFGKPSGSSPGRWLVSGVNQYTNSLYAGSNFFVRVWELPSAIVGTGDIPTNGVGAILYYGNSPTWPSPVSDPGTFSLSSGFSTTSSLTVVPEPGSLTLLLIFGSALAVRLRLRKSAG
ncbi:MAG: hypothetical protein NTV49_04525 [Kiritimatiellaeota bacterium]|nr:hypothetical protein [Kiritimatiellota bacterium]